AVASSVATVAPSSVAARSGVVVPGFGSVPSPWPQALNARATVARTVRVAGLRQLRLVVRITDFLLVLCEKSRDHCAPTGSGPGADSVKIPSRSRHGPHPRNLDRS